MPKPTPSGLMDYAKKHPAARARCLLCTVPTEVEAEARQGKDAGVTYRILGEWLAANGYADVNNPPTQSRLQRHFQDGHGVKRA